MWFLLVIFLSHPSEKLIYRYPLDYPYPFATEQACIDQGNKEQKVLINHSKNTLGEKGEPLSQMAMACVQDPELEEKINQIILNEKRANL